MIKVFVTGVGGGIGQGIIKSLKLIKDLEIMIIGGDITQFSAGMYCVDRSYIIPSVSDLNYIEKLIAILNSESINYFFPGNDKELLLCASNIEKIENSSKATLCISKEEIIRITNDKYLTYQFLVENDIPAPKTRLLNDNLNIFQSEVILKPRIGFGSKGIKQINIEDLDKIDDLDKEKYMIQEIIGNDENEFTCTVVKVDNNISDIVILKRDLRFGDTYKAFPVNSKKITNYVSDIAKKLET